MALPSLIDKQDTFEIIRDQIAAILVAETANQQALAKLAGKDSDDWKLRVYTERSNAWDEYLHGGQDSERTDPSPIVNVWVETSTFPGGTGDTVERQKSETVFNIDVYGYGVSKNDPQGPGHTPGDQVAAYNVQRGVRLVRNILMAAENTYLQLRGTVWKRWPQSITFFEPQRDDRAVQNIVGARLALRVDFNEFSPQVEPETLELLAVKMLRTEDGQIVLRADYNYPLP